MLDVQKRIQVISALLEQNTPETATYAALECRLVIEYVCYERMKMALDLASYADMGGWTPNKVLKAVEELVDEHIASSLTLSIAPQPSLPPGETMTLEERKNLDYKLIGTQAELDIKKLTRLWNALANSALHVQVPKVRTDRLSIHGDMFRVTQKVQECLTEFKKIADGTLISNGFGRVVSIVCDGCGQLVKRRVERLLAEQKVSCANPDCDETYVVEKIGDEVTFERRSIFFRCDDCGTENELPRRKFEEMKLSQTIHVNCSACSVAHEIIGQPFIRKVTTSKDNAPPSA